MKVQHCTVLFFSVLWELQMIKSFPFLLVKKLRYRVRGLKWLVRAYMVSVLEQGVETCESWLSEAAGRS